MCSDLCGKRTPRLFITASVDNCAEENKAERNLIVRSGICAAEVTSSRRLHLMFCIIEANYSDIHEASCGLFATAELLVYLLKRHLYGAAGQLWRYMSLLSVNVEHCLCEMWCEVTPG